MSEAINKRTKRVTVTKIEEYFQKMVELTKQEPENFFKGTIEEFAQKLHDTNEIYIKHRLETLKKQIDAIPEINDIDAEENAVAKELKVTRKRLNDSYNNALLQIGESDAFSSFDTYSVNGLLYNYQLSTAMYASSWVFARAIDRPATDMLRRLWKIAPKFDPKDEKIVIEQNGKNIMLQNKKFDYSLFYSKLSNTKQSLIQANKWSRLYGGAVACLLTNEETTDDFETPLVSMEQLKGKSFKLLVADRYQQIFPSVEMVDDVESFDYNTPLFYNVRVDSGSYRFHHTRVLRFANGEAPEILKRMLMGWGIPEIVRLFNEMNRDERIKNMITSALSKQSLEIIKMSGMKQYMNGQLSPEQEQELDEKLALMNRYRNFNSLIFLDKDDDYIRLDGSSTGTLASLMETNARFVAGSIPMPQVLLYGDQQAGLSGNSFDDLLLYEDHIMGLREERLSNVARKLSFWICWSMGFEPTDIEIIFNSGLSMTDTQKIDNSKSMLEIWKDLMDTGFYTKTMVLDEMLSKRDQLAFGEAITDEVYERIQETEKMEIAKHKEEAIQDKDETADDENNVDIPFQ